MDKSIEINRLVSNKTLSKISKSNTSSILDTSDPGKKYQAIIHQEMENQRYKVQRKNQQQKMHEREAHKKQLIQQINKKRKELVQLQEAHLNSSDLEIRAARNAELKKQRDKIHKLEEEEKAHTAKIQSSKRYEQAKAKQQQLRQQLKIKQSQAKSMRKIHNQTKQYQRGQANKFNKSLVVRKNQYEEKMKQEEKSAFNTYKNQLSRHGMTKNMSTTFSNPTTFVVKQSYPQNTFNKAETEQLRRQQIEKLKQQSFINSRRTAVERGEKVISSIQRQKQYDEYCRQAEQQQINYNLRRLQMGKSNQYAGLKPMTLNQMTLHKKIRSQKQFEQLFIKRNTKINDEHADKYKIIESKMINKIIEKPQLPKWIKRPINYQQNQSLIPEISEGHYSFQESQMSEFNQRSENKPKNKLQKGEKKKVKPKMIIKETAKSNITSDIGKTRMKETRVTNSGKKQDLDYSDSQEDSKM